MSTRDFEYFMLAVTIERRLFDFLAFVSALVENGLLSLMCYSQLTDLEGIGKADN